MPGLVLAPGSLFGANSSGLQIAASNFSSQDRSGLYPLVPGIDESVASGPVAVPSSVPDGGATMALLGLGLVGLGALRRKFQI